MMGAPYGYAYSPMMTGYPNNGTAAAGYPENYHFGPYASQYFPPMQPCYNENGEDLSENEEEDDEEAMLEKNNSSVASIRHELRQSCEDDQDEVDESDSTQKCLVGNTSAL